MRGRYARPAGLRADQITAWEEIDLQAELQPPRPRQSPRAPLTTADLQSDPWSRDYVDPRDTR